MSVTMREMLEAGVHFGHQTRYWNPKMAPYIFGHRNKIHIVNLEKTMTLYQDALKFVRQLTSNKGTISVRRHQTPGSRNRQGRSPALPFALRGLPLAGRHADQLQDGQASIQRLKDMQAMADGASKSWSKKEGLLMQREIAKLERSLGGIKDMNGLPDALFVIDVGYQKGAITEAKKLGIPVIGVVDTNHSPDGVDYVIPGNDDSSRAIKLYARGMADAVLEGRSTSVKEIVSGGSDELCRSRGRRNSRFLTELHDTFKGRAAPLFFNWRKRNGSNGGNNSGHGSGVA